MRFTISFNSMRLRDLPQWQATGIASGPDSPPNRFPQNRSTPVGVAFITGSISAPGLVEALEHNLPKEHPLRESLRRPRPNGRSPSADSKSAITPRRAILSGICQEWRSGSCASSFQSRSFTASQIRRHGWPRLLSSPRYGRLDRNRVRLYPASGGAQPSRRRWTAALSSEISRQTLDQQRAAGAGGAGTWRAIRGFRFDGHFEPRSTESVEDAGWQAEAPAPLTCQCGAGAFASNNSVFIIFGGQHTVAASMRRPVSVKSKMILGR